MYMMNLQENINRIKTVMGLINEQAGGLVSEDVYDAISKIESVFSFTDQNGKINGRKLSGKEVDSQISDYINQTIGLKYWNQIGANLQGLIYQYMYQHDSGSGGMRMWWIAGLAQAIDPSIQRPSISKKPITDPNVQNAIKLIRTAITNGSINGYYDSYKNVLDSQYSVTSSAHPDNYKNVWKYRPKAFERLLKGEDWDTIKKDWLTSINNKTTSQSGGATSQKQASKPETSSNKVVTIKGEDFNDLRDKVKEQTKNISIDVNSITSNMNTFEITYRPGNTKIQTMSLIFDDSGTLKSRMNNIKDKNPGLEEIIYGKKDDIQFVISIIK